MSIIHNMIQVEGFPFTRIKELYISHRPNEHGQITIVGEIAPEDAKDCQQRADETTSITVTSSAGEETVTLFTGGVKNLSVANEAGYSVLTVRGITASFLQDIKKISRTYQNGGKTYEQILNEAYDGNGSVELTVTDQAIGALVMQMDETNWEFTKRMASRFNVPVFTSITAPKPLVFVGLPPVANTKEITTTSFLHGKQDDEYNRVTENYMADGGEALRQDFSALIARSYDYVYLGDIISINGSECRVKRVEARLVDGILEMEYLLAGKTGFVAPQVSNTACAGRVLIGQVKDVQRDTVKVHLIEIDKEYDGSGDWWFPYSTAYSSSDGSGWYCMPEIGDYVRIMFPSKNEADGFAASSINTAPLANPRHKSLKAPSGKELLMTDGGLYIICQHQKIFIDLTQDDGIKIVSAQNITVESEANVTVQAKKDIQVLAKEQILLKSGESFINMLPDQITLAAKDVVIT
ncbi:DUF2345 domain-containing protein [Pelosinus baikalensis]|nr:DUF2345 domain-containing protein [Pelosinus baikalensis]